MNSAYDRIFEAYNSTLDQSERVRHQAGLERLITEEVPIIPHWFAPSVTVHVAALKGPVARQTPGAGPAISRPHEWEWVG